LRIAVDGELIVSEAQKNLIALSLFVQLSAIVVQDLKRRVHLRSRAAEGRRDRQILLRRGRRFKRMDGTFPPCQANSVDVTHAGRSSPSTRRGVMDGCKPDHAAA
jgi:hypothetical protein